MTLCFSSFGIGAIASKSIERQGLEANRTIQLILGKYLWLKGQDTFVDDANILVWVDNEILNLIIPGLSSCIGVKIYRLVTKSEATVG